MTEQRAMEHGAAAQGEVEYRYLFGHAKSADATAIDAVMSELLPVLQRAVSTWQAGSVVRLVSAREEWERTFQSSGGWDQWVRDVPRHVRMDGTPEYHAMVVDHDLCARATAGLIGWFLDMGKPVYLWRDGACLRVHALRPLDPRHMWDKWALQEVVLEPAVPEDRS